VERGIEFVVVNKEHVLHLDSLDAELVSISTSESVPVDYGRDRVAKGVFVVATLRITNRARTPKSFSSFGDNGALILSDRQYSEDFDAENYGDIRSFTNKDDIQPDQTVTGVMVFDVPPERVTDLDTNGNLDIVNFSDEFSFGKPKQIGTFRTYM
jgi:hypothetical protein